MSITKPSESIVTNILNWYHAAQKAGEMPFWIVFTIALYTPFEEFILKWIPGSALFRFLPELILYGTLFVLLRKKLVAERSWNSTPIDFLLLAFLISVFISILVNGSSLIPSALTLRSLLRYLSVFYILANIPISFAQLQLMLNGMKIVGLVQGAIASALFFLPSSVQQIFAPRQFSIGEFERVSAAETGDVKAGSVYSMFTNPAVLAVFLLVALVVMLGQSHLDVRYFLSKTKELASLITLFFGIYATKKRAALFLAFSIPLALLFFRQKTRALLKMGWFYVALLFLAFILLALFGGPIDTSFSGADSKEQTIDFTSYFLQIFSPDYYEQSSEASRGWVIGTVVGTLTKSWSWFGFGPDLDNTREIIYNLLVSGSDRAKIFTLDPIEDVYWFAMLAYYGPIGLGVFLLMIYRLFKAGRWLSKSSPHVEYRALGALFCTLVLLMFIYNFISRVLEVRPFSYYFWLVAGLVVNAYNYHKDAKT